MALREIDGGPDYFAQFDNSLPSDPSFFPIGVWYESVTTQNDINLDKDVGLNLYVVLTGNSNLSLIQNNGMYAILQQSEWRTNQAAIANPAVVGWELQDEIDMVQANAAGAAAARAELNSIIASLPDDGRFLYNNYGKGVMFWNSDSDAEQYVNDFQQVTSVDTYWFTDPDIHIASQGGELLGTNTDLTYTQTRLAANYGYTVDRMRALDAMDGELQPIWNFVEVGWVWSDSGSRQIAPDEIEAAVWHSIIAGAQGIIYFNHSFGGPEQTQHALRDPRYAAERAAVDSTNALIEQLAPVLNAPFDDGFVSVNSSVRAMAKYYNGEHYVFAGATVNGAATSTDSFTLAGVGSGTAQVIGETRTIAIVNGQFADTFADGNAIHIYRIITSGTPTPSAPTITSNGGGSSASLTIQENTTAVTTVVATDADSASITYSISGGVDAAKFTINAMTGVLAFVAAPNFEIPTDIGGNNVYDVLVNASDGSLSDTQSIAVTVTNQNEEAQPIFSDAADTVTLPSLGGTFDALGGDDKLFYTGGWVTIDGGTGRDTIDFSQFGSAVRMSLGSNGSEMWTLDSGSWRAIGNLSSVENFVGTSYEDVLQGTRKDNVIEGAGGNDTLTGSRGSDTFVFGAASGHDTIMDFDDRGNDVIAVSTALFADFAALEEALIEVGSDVVIALDAENSITLTNTSFAGVTEADFLFV